MYHFFTCFKKEFVVKSDKRVIKARAYMAACGVYEGKINGRKIGEFVLAPGITDYRKIYQNESIY